MADFDRCCLLTLTHMANTIDSYKKYPDVAQFVRNLIKLSVEDAYDKLIPFWPWSEEWYVDLAGIGEKGAREIFFRSDHELGFYSKHGPYHGRDTSVYAGGALGRLGSRAAEARTLR